MKKLILFLFLTLFLPSCTQDFSKPRYKGHVYKGAWYRRPMPIWRTGTFRDRNVKKEARHEMIRPKIISFDTW